MKHLLPAVLVLASGPVLAEPPREMGAHEHGVSKLNIAIDGASVLMEMTAPGADIVGFEHAAASTEDRAAIDTAIARLEQPLTLITLPDAAGCTLTHAHAALKGEEHADHDDHEGHDNHKDDHSDHKDHDHEEHDHGDHHDGDHDGEHDRDQASGGHAEFHAEYALTCVTPQALTSIQFRFFDVFENARELEVQVITPKGAAAYEATRQSTKIDLRGQL